MFKPVDSKINFPNLEKEILSWWNENNIAEKYMKRNDNAPENFSFIDGPITANNPMGVHHAWGRTYKDLFLRYKTMQGYKQRYQNGFDGQGLWIEVEVEKELGFKSKRDIESYGIDKFVELCKERVRKFSEIQTQQSIRLGYWMDWDNSYHTMSDENNFTIWHFLKICHQKGWIYEGTDVMPWCPRCGTGLSQHEIATEGYKEIVHPGLYVRFPIIDRQKESLLIWTTTPWTLTANTGVYLDPKLTYAKVQIADGEILYLLENRLFELKTQYEVLELIPGQNLVGLRYNGPFDEMEAQKLVEHRVVGWDDVSENEGTGIVHTAPGAGGIDFKISKKENLSVIAPLDEFGVFIEGFGELTGENVSDVNQLIYTSLKNKGIFYRLDQYKHRYPVCWRCNTELVFRLVQEWFISMKSLRSMIAKVANKIRWIPQFGLQRELDWLKNMDDWMISKKRYWGLALPIFKCNSCGNFDVIGSEAELKQRTIKGWGEFENQSPHRPWIDNIKIQCSKCKTEISRIQDVGNPWLDAGIVPFSTLGYRHDKTTWNEWFPADWISESFPGQFRNWFYSLLTMSTVLEETEPTKTIFSYALMFDDKGEQMHKSKGNAIEFEEAAGKMGADVMRWIYARHNPAANLNFGFDTGNEIRRQFIIPLWNVYSFFVTYANIDRYDPNTPSPPTETRPEIDRWIISELNILTGNVVSALDTFEPNIAAREIENFVEYLSNWYVRRNRRRFWKAGLADETGNESSNDKIAAYSTLYECLTTLTKLLAPFLPFTSEAIYQNLVGPVNGDVASVHLESYPAKDLTKIHSHLTEATRLAMRISSLGRGVRMKENIKVRQPINQVSVHLRSQSEAALLTQVEDQIKEELNTKELSYDTDISKIAEVNVKADVSKLGPKYGAQTPEIVQALKRIPPDDVLHLIESGEVVKLSLTSDSKPTKTSNLPDLKSGNIELSPEDIIVELIAKNGYALSSEFGYTVSIATEISDELALEGLAREFVHCIQNMRRSAGFNIDDEIYIYYQGPNPLESMVTTHKKYIMNETLSLGLFDSEPNKNIPAKTHMLNKIEITLGIELA